MKDVKKSFEQVYGEQSTEYQEYVSTMANRAIRIMEIADDMYPGYGESQITNIVTCLQAGKLSNEIIKELHDTIEAAKRGEIPWPWEGEK